MSRLAVSLVLLAAGLSAQNAAAAEFTQAEAGGQPVTTVHLVLPAVSSRFFIQE
jgi:hypothetical protein